MLIGTFTPARDGGWFGTICTLTVFRRSIGAYS